MNRDILKSMLKLHEGVVLTPYKDTVGKTTIGIGRNLDDVGISLDEATYLLNNDIQRVEDDLDRELPLWRSVSETRQLVLADMCFNLGINGLLGFKNTLAAIWDGRFDDAAEGMRQSKWAGQVGKRADKLISMMKDG